MDDQMQRWAWTLPRLLDETAQLAELCKTLDREIAKHNPIQPATLHSVESQLISQGWDVALRCRDESKEIQEYRWMIVRLVESGEWP